MLLLLFFFTHTATPLSQWLKIQLLVKMYIALISLFYKYLFLKIKIIPKKNGNILYLFYGIILARLIMEQQK